MADINITINIPDLAVLSAAIGTLALAIGNGPATPNAADPDTTTVTIAAPTAEVRPEPKPVFTTEPAPAAEIKPEPVFTTEPAPVADAKPEPAKAYGLDDIKALGVKLVRGGKMVELTKLLGEFNVAAITQLTPEQYNEFGARLERQVG